jgi:hypothetical protein
MTIIVLPVTVIRHALSVLVLQCLQHHLGPMPPGVVVEAAAQRSDEERLEHPTVVDMFEPRYHTGPIQPVTDPHEDPGRARVEELFRKRYPESDLVTARFFGNRVRVQKVVADALARVEKRLATVAEAKPFVRKLGGTYNPRRIAGTDRASAHTWGIAIDLNPDLSHYWRWSKSGWQNRVPQSVVDAFEAEGFIWGGRWYHFDTMHFEYRPELLDSACYER